MFWVNSLATYWRHLGQSRRKHELMLHPFTWVTLKCCLCCHLSKSMISFWKPVIKLPCLLICDMEQQIKAELIFETNKPTNQPPPPAIPPQLLQKCKQQTPKYLKIQFLGIYFSPGFFTSFGGFSSSFIFLHQKNPSWMDFKEIFSELLKKSPLTDLSLNICKMEIKTKPSKEIQTILWHY